MKLMVGVSGCSGRKVHLVCTGALTNVALLITLFSEVAEHLEQIVFMGGAIGSGNTNPCAEFNIQVESCPALITFPAVWGSGSRCS